MDYLSSRPLDEMKAFVHERAREIDRRTQGALERRRDHDKEVEEKKSADHATIEQASRVVFIVWGVGMLFGVAIGTAAGGRVGAGVGAVGGFFMGMISALVYVSLRLLREW